MKTNRIYIIPLLLSLLLLSSCNNHKAYYWPNNIKVQIGDDMDWAAKDFDVSQWEDHDTLPVTDKGVFWARLSVQLPEEFKDEKNKGIMIGATAAYEAYWDGQYLGVNGRLKQDHSPEIPGTYHRFFSLPDSLISPGKHILALRATKSYKEPSSHAYCMVSDYQYLLQGRLQFCNYMFLIAGIFLITAIYFFFLFINRPKEIASLIFGVICLVFFGLLMMEYSKHFYAYTYPFQRTRLVIIGYCHAAISVLIPLFLMLQFKFPWKKGLFAALIGVVLYYEWSMYECFDALAIVHHNIVTIFSMIIILYACYKKQQGAFVLLAACTIGIIIDFVMPHVARFHFVSTFDVSVFIWFVLMLLGMLYLLTINRQAERQQYEHSLVESERLKNELLKKNIRPHFIMNTLTSMIDWVEESPKEGVKFIHALAGEFEILNQIADYKLIPITQEINLCRSHLNVMGYRKEIQYDWEEVNIDPNEIIPPAIIHTAVENGVTHSIPNEEGKITFRLIYEKAKQFKQYTLQTIAPKRPKPTTNIADVPEGTGMKYIKSRLQESFPNQWEVQSHATNEGWETIIKITEE